MMNSTNTDEKRLQEALHALSNQYRFRILIWLTDPKANFPPQRDGDLVDDGVCVGFITKKIGLSQPTVTFHMQTLAKAGLVVPKRIKNWVYYKLDTPSIDRCLNELGDVLRPQY
ncbi:ArsR/SmtB family transcription factor [Erwinia endophytica]|uniref:ArsR/SmtB family transcription factor n=1 Tax=Erwinia endophytica TaxID=1563158 RepID=UPI001F03A068|nr:metalloregulator ArsR/SmtB family transcription factor [Erwinia endophytica]